MPVALAPRARKISAIPPTASRPRIWYLFAVEPTSAATFATPGIVGPHCLGCQTRREEGSTVWWGGVLRRRLGECRILLHFEVSSGAPRRAGTDGPSCSGAACGCARFF